MAGVSYNDFCDFVAVDLLFCLVGCPDLVIPVTKRYVGGGADQ